MSGDSKYYKEIIDKLERLIKREYALLMSFGIQISLLTGTAVFTTFVLLETAGHFSSTLRTVLFFVFIIITAGLFAGLFLLPLLKYFKILRKTDYYKTAGKVGGYFPEIKDDLLNAMQLVSSNPEETKTSPGLINAAFQNVYNRTKQISFESVVDFKKAKQLFLYFAGVAVFCSLIIIFIPGLHAASVRLVEFNREFIPPPRFSFEVEPGNSKLTKGDNFNISVKVTGKRPNEVYLAVKNAEQTGFENDQIYADSNGVYRYEMPAVRSSFKYYAVSGNISSGVYSVEVIDRPIVRTLDLTINSPSYSKIQQVKQKDNGNITALMGSRIDLSLSSTKALKSAKIEFGDTTKKNLSVNSDFAKGGFTVTKDNNYKIIITDAEGNENLSPINYSIKVLYDAYPSIDMVAPNRDVSLNNDNRLPLEVKVSDDYGFTKLVLHYRLLSSKFREAQKDYQTVSVPIDKSSTEQDIKYIWNLSGLNLTAEDVVTYYLEVFDNDNVSGPKSAKTASFTVRIPTLDEMLTKADNTQSNSINDMKETLKKAEDLKQKLNEINQDLRQDKKDISWQEKQKIEQAVKDFKDLQNKVSEVSKKIDEMRKDLQQNNLLSKETLEKYMELQKLFDQISTPEMKKAIEKMQDILQSMNRQMTQEQMKNLQLNEDMFKKSLERTMNLLKRIQVEQKLDELAKRTDQISKNQNEISKQTDKENLSDKRQNNELSEKQDQVTKDLDELSKQLDELSKNMSELKDMPQQQAENLQKEFAQQKNQQASKQASQNIKQGQQQMAQQNQSQIMQNMQQMKQQVQQMQKSLQQQSQMQTFTDMMKITDNLISLSKQQEKLREQTEQTDPNSSSFNQNAQQQSDIQNNLQKVMQQMSSLSQKTFAVTPEMGKSLGDANSEMSKSIQGMQNRNGQQSAGNQGKAMESLNQAAYLMKSSMEQMMKGGGQGGMMSLMQQLQQMSGQQMSINNFSQMLQQAMQGKLTMQQQAQLQRIAQQQEALRKSLEQLNKEAMKSGESKKIPADLNHIAQQMEEVVKNMNSDNLDQQVLQQQEHILSRLLEAQHSINERDYENQRQAQAGKDIVGKPPAELNLSGEQGKNKIRDELNKAVREGYTKDYEELIRRYYELLQKEKAKQ